ncbi:MAG: ATP-dependent DNA helicase RecG [Phenylobacterium sp.]|uniref:ATP-dependent DNA helicase RecG n=1 Tax=Phenylobacterium sp. TaxID=1871053 RepID=UPI0025F1F29F|nr:ATP-dependent DNA helicase RecG [Phenylobacterium sp.]MCA6244814.1 ATP-dependent DNA helicase RecG [Phenylobacterium sp.]MCA6276137.1 ATP-dependent DNA helicase RecG [Phenylobacterium sp.]MCA6293324.1 ATP-dependent DNA helicase RecG [Phenylobacterium sp.]
MRPEILFPLFAPIASLKGVGPRIAPALEKIAGPLVRDLLFLAPHNLVRRPRRTVAEARPEETATVLVTVTDHLKPRSPQQPLRIRAGDETGQLDLVYFGNSARGMDGRLPVGARRWVSGRLERFGLDLQMVHPDYVVEESRVGDIPEVETVYPAGGGLAPRLVRRFVLTALERAPDLPEWQDPAWRQGRGFPSWREALRTLHAPAGESDLSPAAPARSRLAYDELLAHQLAMAQRRAHRRSGASRRLPASDLAARIEGALPFRLTPDQQTSLKEIRDDLASGQRMSRLLQGDVGSGKTVVAMLALADAAAAGAQGALMAPTEILARQHFETLAGPLEAHGIGVVLLTGRDRGPARREKLERLASGVAAVAVGTHALFQDEVRFADLALAVIDEQHRFGVGERQRLLEKGAGVHLLSMSATPIPRTLELAAYGDLDVSRIIGKPPGRTPVATRAAPMTRLVEVEDRLVAAVLGGAQAFWICPLVSESELVDLKAAEKRAQDLQLRLGGKVGLVHGKLAPTEKDAVMADFASGKVRVLVATTVVEVGVNVPNATIMVIEQAERFGLAQLHQLRGRVGRGRAESACVLLYDPPLSETAQRRLDILRRSDDGFAIAETDLELRGGGDALGLRQSGFPDYVFVDPFIHRDLILAAGDDARLILARDPGFASPRGEALKVLQALFDWRPEAGMKGA